MAWTGKTALERGLTGVDGGATNGRHGQLNICQVAPVVSLILVGINSNIMDCPLTFNCAQRLFCNLLRAEVLVTRAERVI